MQDLSSMRASLTEVQSAIHQAQGILRPPRLVKLVAVSKKQPLAKMLAYQQLCREMNLPCVFGENYVQEFEEKAQDLRHPFEAHLIGPLQSNKAEAAVRLFDVIETIDRPRIAQAVNRAAARAGKRQKILAQVNISNDPGKHGLPPGDVARFVEEELGSLSNLEFCGVMAITRLYQTAEEARNDFRALRELSERLPVKLGEKRLEISMGMSQDFKVAVEEGASIVRVGSAIFGARD